MPHRKDILLAAQSLTCGDRNQSYGDPAVNLSLAGKLKATFWGHVAMAKQMGAPIREINPAEQEAIDMVLTKLARIGTGTYKEDNYVDAAAYIAIAGQVGAPPEEPEEPVEGEEAPGEVAPPCSSCGAREGEVPRGDCSVTAAWAQEEDLKDVHDKNRVKSFADSLRVMDHKEAAALKAQYDQAFPPINVSFDVVSEPEAKCRNCRDYDSPHHVCLADGSKQEYDHACHLPHMFRKK